MFMLTSSTPISRCACIDVMQGLNGYECICKFCNVVNVHLAETSLCGDIYAVLLDGRAGNLDSSRVASTEV